MIVEEKRPLKDGMPPMHRGEFLAEDIAEQVRPLVDYSSEGGLPYGAG